MKNKKMRENLLACFYIKNTPISSENKKIVVPGEIFKTDDVDCCCDIDIEIPVDMYLDMLLEKNTYKGDGDIYFSSQVFGDFEKYNKIIKKVVLDNGILSAYNEEKGSYTILKEI